MDQLKIMKEQLIAQVQGQMGKLSEVDAKEMGEVIDMIKDLAEATYYCTVTEAMEKKDEESQKEPRDYYTPYYRMPSYDDMMYDPYRDMDKERGKMYYSGGRGGNGPTWQGQGGRGGMNPKDGMNSNSSSYYIDPYGEMYPMHVHDFREGRSPLSRKSYIESKEMHKDTTTQIQELEKYMRELSQDITEMIQDATPEERQMLHQKMVTLAEKI